MTIRSSNGEPDGSDARVGAEAAGPAGRVDIRHRDQKHRRERFGRHEDQGPHGRDERFDRQIRAFGTEAQARLSRLTVAVVGAGGAGSLLVQGLAHLGVGHLVVVDPDVLDTTNLNRVVGSTPADAENGTPKIDVAARLARAVDPVLKVAAIHGSVLDSAVWRLLKCADILLGAVDGHAPRWALNILAVQYSRYYIDVGVEIGTIDGTNGRRVTCAGSAGCTGGVVDVGGGFMEAGIADGTGGAGHIVTGRGHVNAEDAGGSVGGIANGIGNGRCRESSIRKLEVGGHVAVVRPGGPCLLCQDGYDPRLAAVELDPVTQQARRSAGYLPAEADEPAPSVLFLNQAIVAHALAEVLNIVWPWRTPTTQILIDLVKPAMIGIDAERDPRCPACGPGSVRGLADTGGEPPFPTGTRPPSLIQGTDPEAATQPSQ